MTDRPADFGGRAASRDAPAGPSRELATWRRGLLPLAQGAAALAGLVAGFEFGDRLSGPLLGLLAAANSALFASLMVGAIADALARLARAGRSGP